ncbi:hypothetical protein ACFVYD_27360 [Streptomyces sp. NPDC058301]|uniref:hypothetical protein n=1 Tax=Streptomyces sp. NPDC058301 TaxID=3346436 RepID=UPI0036EE5261
MKLLAGKRLSTAVAGVLLAGLFVPATGAAATQAAGSRLSVEGCSSKTDNRSSDNWTAADWKICIGDYGGENGSADVKCYAGQTVGWNASLCTIYGRFEISKGNEVIKSGQFALDVPLNGAVTSVPFRFYCQGPGEYTFRTSGVQATLVRVGRDGQLEARSGFQTAHIADATATVTMC